MLRLRKNLARQPSTSRFLLTNQRVSYVMHSIRYETWLTSKIWNNEHSYITRKPRSFKHDHPDETNVYRGIMKVLPPVRVIKKDVGIFRGNSATMECSLLRTQLWMCADLTLANGREKRWSLKLDVFVLLLHDFDTEIKKKRKNLKTRKKEQF